MYSQHSEDDDEEEDSHGDSDSLYPGASRAHPTHTPVCTVSIVRMVRRMIVVVMITMTMVMMESDGAPQHPCAGRDCLPHTPLCSQ